MRRKIVIVEDHADMQLIYKTIFRRSKDIEISSQVETAEMALDEIEKTTPELALIDISLPGMSGIDLAGILKKKYPKMKLLIVTGHDRDRYYDAAISAGADELIIKGDTKILLETVKILLGIL